MTKGIIDTCCGYGADGKKSNYDCVQIPSASKAADNLILGVAGFCGINGLVSLVAGTASATICCKIKIYLRLLYNPLWLTFFFFST